MHLTCIASTLSGATNVDLTYLCKIRVVQIAVLGHGGIKGRVELVTQLVVGGWAKGSCGVRWVARAVEIAALWNMSEEIIIGVVLFVRASRCKFR